MYLVAIAWMYVALMMAVSEATAPQGTVLGAVISFVFYGLLPLSIVMYLMGSRARRRAALAREAASDAPDGGPHAAADRVAPEREEP